MNATQFPGFNNPTIVYIHNATDPPFFYDIGNVTVNAGGVLRNTTENDWAAGELNITYTYSRGFEAAGGMEDTETAIGVIATFCNRNILRNSSIDCNDWYYYGYIIQDYTWHTKFRWSIK